MDRLIVNGEKVRAIGYEARKGDLEVRLIDGSVLLYMGVPAGAYVAWVNADDKDSYYEGHISNVFVFRSLHKGDKALQKEPSAADSLEQTGEEEKG